MAKLLTKDSILQIEFNFCGVYFLENKVNHNDYIGATIRLRKRLLSHLKKLKQDQHSNKELQKEWNKYQQDRFVFGIIEETTKEKKRDREQYYIDKLKPEYNKIMNIREGPNPNEISQTLKGREFSQEHKDKLAQANKNRVWREESRKKNRQHRLNSKLSDKTKEKISQSLKGRKVREETREKIRKSHKGISKNKGENNPSAKLTAGEVKDIKEELQSDKLTHKEIAILYSVSKVTIDKISEGKAWSHIGRSDNDDS